ncbi:MAG: O-antigen ligase family protein [Chloroflexota bacterium]|nr:MAG: O-antigen ligase family protein [Chloroflexota bacterium]
MRRDQAAKSPATLLGKSKPALVLGLSAGVVAVVGGLVLAFGGPIAAAGLLLAILAAMVVLREIEVGFWAIVIVVCLIPFATIPVDLGLTPTLLDLALAATVGIWFLRLVTGRQRSVITAPVTLPLIIFVVLAVFAFIFGLANGPLTTNLLRHFAELLISLGFVFVVIDYFTEWDRLERMIGVIIMAGAGAAAAAIFLWLLPDTTANDILNMLQRVGYPGGLVIRYIEENPELAERAIGTSVDPNALGGLLLMIGALLAPQLLAKRTALPRRWTVVAGGLIFVALILTFSRGALVGLAAGLGFVALARYRRLLPYLLAGGILFLVLPVTQGYLERFVEGIQGQDLATQMRFGEYRDAMSLIARYPLFGVGFAGSPDIDLYLGVANVYLTIGQQMGVSGLVSFAAVIGTVFGYGFFNRACFKGNERLDPIWIGLHAALVGGLVVGIFDHYLFNIDFHHAVTVFWLFLGLAVAATRTGCKAVREMGGGIAPPGTVDQ